MLTRVNVILLLIISLFPSPEHAENLQHPQHAADSIFSAAKSFYKTKNYAQCIDLLMEYRELAGANYALEYYLGMSFFYVEHYNWAALHLKKARVINRSHEDAIIYILAQIYASAGYTQLSKDRYGELAYR